MEIFKNLSNLEEVKVLKKKIGAKPRTPSPTDFRRNYNKYHNLNLEAQTMLKITGNSPLSQNC